METILVVEDESSLRENIQETLELNDYVILTAENGLKALSILEKNIPDLVISDIMMPLMDGYQLLEACQKDPRISSVPFIFLSAKSGESDIRKGMNGGADDYVTKPFKVKDLLLAVETRLQKKKKIDSIIKETTNTVSHFVPHELRTPLVSIMGFTQLLIDEYDNIKKEEVVDFLTKIKTAGSRLHKTIEKFLFYSDLSLSKVKPCKDPESCITLDNGHTAVFLTNTMQYYKRCEDVKIDLEKSRLLMCEKHFFLLLDELIENALKFSSPGTDIKIFGRLTQGSYKLEVIDFGIGISAENLKTMAPFVQHQRELTGQDGTGLGFAIVQQLLNLYDASLAIESQEGKFTRIILTIPVAE